MKKSSSKSKRLAKPSDFYDISIDVFGVATPHPIVKIVVDDESEDGLLPLCDKINEYIEQGYRFTKFQLSGDMIGWKYFEMEMEKQ